MTVNQTMNNDLISREALRNEVDTWGCNDYDKYDFLEAIDNASTVEYPFYQEAYQTGYEEAKKKLERQQGEEISKIKEITERALRSEDPINLYKARALDDIAEILGIEIKEPEAEEANSKDQITIDDIIKEG